MSISAYSGACGPMRILFLLAATTMLFGCDAPRPAPIPLPNELARQVQAVVEAVETNEPKLDNGTIERQLALLEKTIAAIAHSYGTRSVETVQALTMTSGMLARKDRPDLAIPFMERALSLSREVYGPDHRETAYPLHDVAVLLCLQRPGEYVRRAELLYRGALTVRRRRAGPDDPETAATEAQLAWQLLLGSTREALRERELAALTEAENLATHARDVFAAHSDASYALQIHRILVETAFARGDYSEVERRAQVLLNEGDYEKGPGLFPDETGADLLAKARAVLRASPRLNAKATSPSH